MKNFTRGFTLAETLITLGIIGVVASMAIPSLIQKYKRHETTARLKKFYSTISQAIVRAEADLGMKVYEWDSVTMNSNNPGQAHNETLVYYNKYLAPYIKTLKVEKGVYDKENNIDNKTKVYFPDSSSMEISSGYCINLLYDINGDKKPNELGRDRFVFFIATAHSWQSEGREQELYKNHSFNAGYLPLYNTKEKALEACKRGGQYCSAYLMYNNFEIPEEYPYKI